MRTIRNNVFETNSSSTHSICISKETVNTEDIPHWLNIIPDDYGWSIDVLQTVEEKASYIYSAMEDLDMLAEIKEFTEYLTELNIKWAVKDCYGSVDHCGELIEFIHDILLNKDKLNRFLFNSKSVIYTGNDNGCDENCMCWIACDDSWDDDEETVCANTKQDIENFEYYFKGN